MFNFKIWKRKLMNNTDEKDAGTAAAPKMTKCIIRAIHTNCTDQMIAFKKQLYTHGKQLPMIMENFSKCIIKFLNDMRMGEP